MSSKQPSLIGRQTGVNRNKTIAGLISVSLMATGALSSGDNVAGRQQVAYKPEVPRLSLLSFEDIGEELRFSRAQHMLADEARSLRPHIGDESDQKQAVQRTLYATLSASQRKRLVELSVQHRWPDTLLSDYVSKSIALTDEQRGRLETMFRQYYSTSTLTAEEAAAHATRSDPAKPIPDRMEAAKVWRDASKRQRRDYLRAEEARTTKALAVLTKEQVRLIDEVRGEEYPVRFSYRDLNFHMRNLLADRHVQVDLGFSLKESVEFFDEMESDRRNPEKTALSGNAFSKRQFERLSASQQKRLRQAAIQIYGATMVLSRFAAQEIRLTPKQRTDLALELADVNDDEHFDLFTLELRRQAKLLDTPSSETATLQFQMRAQNEQEHLAAMVRSSYEAKREAALAKVLTPEQARRWKAIQGRKLTFLDMARRNHPLNYL